MRLTTQFSALPVGRCSRKRRIRPLLKQTCLCKFIIIVSSEQINQIFCGLLLLKYMVMKYMVFGFHSCCNCKGATSVFRAHENSSCHKGVSGNDLDTPTWAWSWPYQYNLASSSSALCNLVINRAICNCSSFPKVNFIFFTISVKTQNIKH